MGRTACTEPQCLYKVALYLWHNVLLPVYILTDTAPRLTILDILIIIKDFVFDFRLSLRSRLELQSSEMSVKKYYYSLRNNAENHKTQERYMFEALE
jgi:hypothetical protein